MSTFNETGVMDVKTRACDLLLAQRVEQKMSGNKIEQVVNRIRVSQPKPRAGKADVRLVKTNIPLSVTAAKAAKAAAAEIAKERASKGGSSSTDLPDADDVGRRRTQRDVQEDEGMGGAGVYSLPLQTHWQLKTPEWVNDIIPEIMDGKNILDFVDPDIEQRLQELEEEEEQRGSVLAAAADTLAAQDARVGQRYHPRDHGRQEHSRLCRPRHRAATAGARGGGGAARAIGGAAGAWRRRRRRHGRRAQGGAGRRCSPRQG